MFLAQLSTMVKHTINAQSSANYSHNFLTNKKLSFFQTSAILNGKITQDAPMHHHFLLEIAVLKYVKTSLLQIT